MKFWANVWCALGVMMLVGCDDSVPLIYSTKHQAAAEGDFARGWLPDIIPSSSRNISMKNNLDENSSSGDFLFDAKDGNRFVEQLKRVVGQDKEGFSAYSYKEWIFWISDSGNYCRFQMHSQHSTTCRPPL